MTRTRLRDEGGWALVTALILMLVMLGVGLAALAFVDRQQIAGSDELRGESRFNLADAVLNAQSFSLSRRWPSPEAGGFSGCVDVPLSGGAPGDARCIVPDTLRAAFDAPEYAGATFTTRISDNTGGKALFYDPSVATSAQDLGGPESAAEPDDQVWVEATARVRNRTRTVVALVRLTRRNVGLPAQTLVAGKLGINPMGNRVVINTQGDSSQATGVSLRCTAGQPGCLTSGLTDPGKTQMLPQTPNPQPYGDAQVLGTAAVDALRESALSSGTYYDTCPPSLPTEGDVVVYIKSGDCEFATQGEAHTHVRPGVLVLETGTLTFGGSYTYHGTVYAMNRQASTGYVVNLRGSAIIDGSVLIDGSGGFYVHDMGALLVFNDNTARERKVAGEGLVVRNTWRELPAA